MVDFNIFLEIKKSFLSYLLCYPSFPNIYTYLYVYIDIHLSVIALTDLL